MTNAEEASAHYKELAEQAEALEKRVEEAEKAEQGYVETPRGEVLLEARNLIVGDRNVTYGSPTENFKNIADFFNIRFGHKLAAGETFTATDVADFMILVKVARNIAQTKRDNFVDIAGYAACGYETTLDEN